MKKENEVNIHKRQSVEEWEEAQKEFTRRMEADILGAITKMTESV